MRSPNEPVGPPQLVQSANLEIARTALRCSAHVSLSVEGNADAIVRHALLRGLICTVSADPSTVLSISGPLALFRRTTMYGRHLADLVPLLPWSRRFQLSAHCIVRGREGTLVLRTGDPIPAGPEPRRYDSALERRFARDFMCATDDWELVREPEPVAAESTLIFPDFLLQHRRDPARRWLLEIVGFWTADYLAQKLRRLRAAGLERLILCIDAAKDCGVHELPAAARVVRFKRRIDVREVLRIVDSR